MSLLLLKRSRPFRLQARIGIVALTALFASSATITASAFEPKPSPIKQCAPVHLKDGEKIDFNAFKGKIVYVDFWASWCGPCRASFPFMNELNKEFADDVVILGLSVDSSKEDADRFLAKTPADFNLAIDTEGVCPKEFVVKGMPSSYILGRNGDLLYSHTGFRKSDVKKIRAALIESVKQQSAPTETAAVDTTKH